MRTRRRQGSRTSKRLTILSPRVALGSLASMPLAIEESRRSRERRRFLLGLGSAALSVPLCLREAAVAAAVPGAAPRRVLVFSTAMGTIKQHWVQPPGPLTALGPIMAPLQPYLKDLNLILNDGGGVHEGGGHPGLGRMLTGLANKQTGAVGPGNGASIDQYLGKVLGAATRFPVLELGAALDYSNDPLQSFLAWAEGNKPMISEGDPKKVFERLYGSQPISAEPPKPRVGPKAMVDRLANEIGALQSRLSGEERLKLDVHLASIRGLEKQLAGLATQSCDRPTPPTAACGCRGDHGEYKVAPQQLTEQIDLAVNALACDMTRVISFQLGAEGGSSMRFPFLPLDAHGETAGQNMHFYSHMDRPDDYVDGGPMYAIHLWYAQQFAYLLSRLAGVIDTDGKRLLDNTLVVWASPMGEGRLHDSERLPLVTAGSAGGAVRTGQSIVTKDRFINDLWSTVGHVMGAPIDTFGDAMLSKGPITELLT